EPVQPPYEPEVGAALQAMMPRNSPVEPLKLFRTLARHRPLAAAMTALGRFVLGRELSLDLHDRELVIDRVCARCACEYEWAVHAISYGARAALSPEQLTATVSYSSPEHVAPEASRGITETRERTRAVHDRPPSRAATRQPASSTAETPARARA